MRLNLKKKQKKKRNATSALGVIVDFKLNFNERTTNRCKKPIDS